MIIKIFCRYTAWYKFELIKTAVPQMAYNLYNASFGIKTTVLLES